MKLLDIPGHKDLKRHPATGKIYVRMFRTGKSELCKSTKTDNIREARKVADIFIQDFFGVKPKSKTVPLIEELWPRWIDTKSERAKNTKDSIKYSWARLSPFWGGKLPNEINSINWESYVSELRLSDPNTKLFNDRKWFRSFILWMHENGFIDKCPKLRNPDPKKPEAGRYLTKEEFKALIEASHPELQLQILIGYTMGMRIGEIMCLKWGVQEKSSYVDLEKRIIHLSAHNVKTRDSRTMGISDSVYPELVLRYQNRISDCVWPSLKDKDKPMTREGHKRAWEYARNKTDIKCRTHDLRHTFLTNAFKAARGKIDSLLICAYAGLSIETAQKVYLHFTYEDTRAVSALITV